MQPRISIVVPVYNVEKYLETCLRSILSQTLPAAEMEIICVDDGATDSCPEILDRYAAEYEHIRVIHQTNGGLSAARNTGLDAAQGKYIYFLDSDDRLIRDDALEMLCARAEALDLDELLFNSQIRFETESMRLEYDAPEDPYRPKHDYPGIYSGREFFSALLDNGDYACVVWLRMYRRGFLEEHGLRFVPGIVHEDEVFTLQCLSLERRAAHLDLYLHEQLCRPNSIMTCKSKAASIRGTCLGVGELDRFARNRLADADPAYLRRYRGILASLTDRAAHGFLNLSRRERAQFLRSLPPSERAEVEGLLRPDVQRIQRRELRLAFKKRIPAPIWAVLKKIKRR